MASVANFSVKTVDFVVEDVAITKPAQLRFARLTPGSFTRLVMDVRNNSVMSAPEYQ